VVLDVAGSNPVSHPQVKRAEMSSDTSARFFIQLTFFLGRVTVNISGSTAHESEPDSSTGAESTITASTLSTSGISEAAMILFSFH
jgi:hypothetical protein